jgi:hypothetical protein
MTNEIRSAIGGLALMVSAAFGGESNLVASVESDLASTNEVAKAVNIDAGVVTNAPVCIAMRFTDVTFPVRTNALELTYGGFNTTGDWYLLTADALNGANTVWRPATNQGYNHSRFGYIKGAFPFEVTTTNAPTIITEYLDASKPRTFFRVVNSTNELNQVSN